MSMAIPPARRDAADADLLLVRQFARGEASAYDQLVEKYQGRIAGLAYRLIGWRPEVEDIVQEVFLAALRGLPRFRERCSVSTWLTTITVNKCRSHRRRAWLFSRWRKVVTAESAGGCSREPLAGAADQPLQHREKMEHVRRGIDQLPNRYREVVVLRYLQQMSVNDVADVLSIRPLTVQVRLHRARARLRGLLEDLVQE